MTVFKEIFSGDLFKKGMVINNTPFLVYVPFLMQYGVIMRTPRGREVTEKAYTHVGKIK